MAQIIILIFCVILAGAGCSDNNPVKEYGSTLTGAVKKAEKAKAAADLLTIKAEIMRSKVDKGEYPSSLQDLNLQDIYTDLYSYDPETGAVALAK